MKLIKITHSSKSLVSDTTHVKTPYNCDTVNVSTPDPTNTVQNTEQATSIAQNTEHASEKTSISNCHESTNVRKQQKAISNRPKSDKEEIIVTQKTRRLNLENEVRPLKAVVNTMTIETSRNSNTNNYQDNRNCANTTTRDSLYDPNDHQITWIRNELFEQRIRILETQMMQNMCISTASTALNTHLALQSRPFPPSPPPYYYYNSHHNMGYHPPPHHNMGYHPPPYHLQPYTHQFPGFIPPPSYPPFTQHCNLRPSTSHLVPNNKQFVQQSSGPPHMVHQQQMAYPTQSTRPSSQPHSTISQPSTMFNQAQRDHPEQQTKMRQISAPQPADVHIQAVANSTKSVHKESHLLL